MDRYPNITDTHCDNCGKERGFTGYGRCACCGEMTTGVPSAVQVKERAAEAKRLRCESGSMRQPWHAHERVGVARVCSYEVMVGGNMLGGKRRRMVDNPSVYKGCSILGCED